MHVIWMTLYVMLWLVNVEPCLTTFNYVRGKRFPTVSCHQIISRNSINCMFTWCFEIQTHLRRQITEGESFKHSSETELIQSNPLKPPLCCNSAINHTNNRECVSITQHVIETNGERDLGGAKIRSGIIVRPNKTK